MALLVKDGQEAVKYLEAAYQERREGSYPIKGAPWLTISDVHDAEDKAVEDGYDFEEPKRTIPIEDRNFDLFR